MRILLAAIALLGLTAVGLAQSSAPAPLPPSAAEASIHAYGDRDKACLAWTDHCRSCARHEGDEVSCSNIGIACQPAEIVCTERRPEPAK